MVTRRGRLEPYYSALGDPFDLSSYPPLDRADTPHGPVFQHDLAAGIPAEMHLADVWYLEPPWQAGFDKFAALAGQDGQRTTYAEMMRGLSAQITAAGKPTYLITGQHGLRHLTPDTTGPVLLWGDPAVAAIWQADGWADPVDTLELLTALAGRHQRIGDFTCGLGRAGRVFAQHGRQFILSDLNARCVGYIAHHAAGWSPR